MQHGYRQNVIPTENKNFVRDLNSKALLATNKEAVDEYKLKSGMLKRTRDLDSRVTNMEKQLQDIHELLLRIVDNK